MFDTLDFIRMNGLIISLANGYTVLIIIKHKHTRRKADRTSVMTASYHHHIPKYSIV